MSRRQRSIFEELQSTHWGVGLVAGFFVLTLGFVVVPALSISSPILSGMVKQLVSGPLSLLVWLVAGICWLASFSAFLGRGFRRRLLDTRCGLDSIRAMSWRQFELLVGEAYRRLGIGLRRPGWAVRMAVST